MPMKVSALVARSLRLSSDSGSISHKGFELEPRITAPFRHFSQSSTSSWGTGEPPEDESPTDRGVTSGQPRGESASSEKPVGRQADEPTSTSNFDTEAVPGGQKQEPKKSRTGGTLTDDGQVDTPTLQKMRSTRDIINDAGREKEERLSSEKKAPA